MMTDKPPKFTTSYYFKCTYCGKVSYHDTPESPGMCGRCSCKTAYHDKDGDKQKINPEYVKYLEDKVEMYDFFYEGNGFKQRELNTAIQIGEYIDKLEVLLTKAKELLKRCYDNHIYLEPLRSEIAQFLSEVEKND